MYVESHMLKVNHNTQDAATHKFVHGMKCHPCMNKGGHHANFSQTRVVTYAIPELLLLSALTFDTLPPPHLIVYSIYNITLLFIASYLI